MHMAKDKNEEDGDHDDDDDDDDDDDTVYGRYGMPVVGDSLATMNLGGSKGSIYTTLDGVGQCGMQAPNGEMVGTSQRGRCTAFGRPGEVSLEERGYVQGNFTRGLSTSDICLYATTATFKMAESSDAVSQGGTISKQANSALNPTTMRDDGTVGYRDRQILQPLYGADGTHPAYIKYVTYSS